MKTKSKNEGQPETARLFVALPVPREWRQALAGTVARLSSYLGERALRWVPTSNWHITLRFIGSVKVARIGCLKERLEQAARQSRPFSLNLASVGCFDRPGKEEVLWVGVSGELTSLSALADMIGKACALEIDRPERFTFHPHITLCRAHSLGGLKKQSISDTAAPFPHQNRFRSFSLFRSQLQRGGSVYTSVHSFPLGAANFDRAIR